MITEKDWLFETDKHICSLRVAGVLIKDGNILVQRDSGGEEYALPGGHVKAGETLEEALVREFIEETGAEIVCKRMLWSEECFWEWKGKNAHGIVFYFLVELSDGSFITGNDEFTPNKDNVGVEMGWMSLDKLSGITVYPEFLSREILNVNIGIKHFISK